MLVSKAFHNIEEEKKYEVEKILDR